MAAQTVDKMVDKMAVWLVGYLVVMSGASTVERMVDQTVVSTAGPMAGWKVELRVELKAVLMAGTKADQLDDLKVVQSVAVME